MTTRWGKDSIVFPISDLTPHVSISYTQQIKIYCVIPVPIRYRVSPTSSRILFKLEKQFF